MSVVHFGPNWILDVLVLNRLLPKRVENVFGDVDLSLQLDASLVLLVVVVFESSAQSGLPLGEEFKSHGLLLPLVNLGEVLFFELGEDLPQVLRVVEIKLVLVVFLRHVDQVQIHQLVETILPLVVGDALVNGSELLCRLFGTVVLVYWELSQEVELHLDGVVDLVVVLEDYVVVQIRVSLVPLNPISLQTTQLAIRHGCSGFQEFDGRKV